MIEVGRVFWFQVFVFSVANLFQIFCSNGVSFVGFCLLA